jgi:hypothetical protein
VGCDAIPKPQALKKSEALLEEDGVRFDQFLRQSDQKMVSVPFDHYQYSLKHYQYP